MSNFLVIFICLFAGMLCKKFKTFPATTAHSLNLFIIFISLPSVILSQIPKLLSSLNLEGTWWLPISMAWIHFALSYAFFSYLGNKRNWSQAKTGALILTAGLGNTSFVGFPLLEALIGPQAISIGVLVDQPGSFLVLSTVGILTAALFSGAKVTAGYLGKRVLTFPPFLSLLASLVWFFSGVPGQEFLLPAFEKMAGTLVPMALFGVGFQLRLDLKVLKKRWLPLTYGLAFKLIAMPIFFTLFYIHLFGGRDLATYVTVLESAMATMITSAVVSTEFNLDSELANLMVGISIPLSLLTVPIWNWILTSFYFAAS